MADETGMNEGMEMPEEQGSEQQVGKKDFTAALLLSILLGGLGVDRFYLGYIGLGVLKLITGGGCGIWYIVDIILIATGKMQDADGNDLQR